MLARPRGTDHARLITVIETVSLCGRGTPEDPAHIQVQYWSTTGKLLAVGISEEVNEEINRTSSFPVPSDRPKP